MSNYFSDQMLMSKHHGWYLYVAAEPRSGYAKIGTAANPKLRLRTLQAGNPRDLRLIQTWHTTREIAFGVEADILGRHNDRRARKRCDWIRCRPETLVYEVNDRLAAHQARAAA